MATRIFKRKIYDTMLDWKNKHAGRTALLIKGARRIGKSTISKEFAEKEYRSHILIDFAHVRPEILELFNEMWDLDMFFFRLQQFTGVTLYQRESVVVMDEIQLCPKARQAIKYLVADGRFDYIETGSLISIHKNVKDIVIPSEEYRVNMYPLDYEEFLWAVRKPSSIPYLKVCLDKLSPMGEQENRAMMRDFRLYTLIGGMPQAINTYLESNSLEEVDQTKREIIELYLNDFRKIDPSGKLSRIFMSIPGELSKNKLKYEVGAVIENAETSKLGGEWFDLEESMTVNFCYRCADPQVGLGLHRESNSFKLYMGDTGLFITLAFWDYSVTENAIYNKLLADKLPADLGYVYENVVAQSLRAAGHSLFYYTFPASNNHSYEIDFLLRRNEKLVPIEVKSSGYKTHKSLDAFMEKFHGRVSRPILLSPKPLRTDGPLIILPLYMSGLI